MKFLKTFSKRLSTSSSHLKVDVISTIQEADNCIRLLSHFRGHSIHTRTKDRANTIDSLSLHKDLFIHSPINTFLLIRNVYQFSTFNLTNNFIKKFRRHLKFFINSTGNESSSEKFLIFLLTSKLRLLRDKYGSISFICRSFHHFKATICTIYIIYIVLICR